MAARRAVKAARTSQDGHAVRNAHEPGDFIGYRGRGQAHTMVNDGPTGEVLRCIVAGQRTAHEVGDYPRAGKRLYVDEGRPWAVVDTADVQSAGTDAGKK